MSDTFIDPIQDARSLFSLEGRGAIVTGGGSGMGRQLSLGLAGAGAKVLVFDLNAETAESVVGEIAEAGGEAVAFEGNVTDEDAVAAAVARAGETVGGPDILINNAGVLSLYDLMEMEMAEWDKVMGINLRGGLLFMKAVMPGMVERGEGSIISIGSSWSAEGSIFNQSGGGPDYCVSKAAIQALTKTAAHTAADSGVRVNAIAPGAVIDTPMHEFDREELDERYKPWVPMGRSQHSTDIVGTAIYLASRASAYVTGQTIHVNGGLLMVD